MKTRYNAALMTVAVEHNDGNRERTKPRSCPGTEPICLGLGSSKGVLTRACDRCGRAQWQEQEEDEATEFVRMQSQSV